MEKTKHILFISSWYPNRNDPTFGIFNRYFAQAASLYNKISVLNVSSEDDLHSDFEYVELVDEKVSVINVYYKKINSTLPFVSQLRKRSKVIKAFETGYERLVAKAGKPDMIHLNVVMPMGIGAYHLSKKHHLPYVVNENWSGYTEEDGNYKGFLQKYFTEKIVKGAYAIMPTSEYLKKAMLGRGLNGTYTVIPNVVNVNVFKPGTNTSSSALRLIHISSLNDREKNVSGIIRAFSKALQSNANMELKIVGEGVDKGKYEAMVKQLQLTSKIKFTGRLLSTQLVNEINASDALIMFSNYETFCLVIVEAFACGKPVITSNAGAIADYMRPALGIMVNKRDEDELSEAILRFGSMSGDFNRDYIRQYAVDNYSYEEVGKMLDEIYDAILKNKT